MIRNFRPLSLILLYLVHGSGGTGLAAKCRQRQCVAHASTLLRRAIIGSVACIAHTNYRSVWFSCNILFVDKSVYLWFYADSTSVTDVREGRVLGDSHAIAYCTNASRGLSPTAELLVNYGVFKLLCLSHKMYLVLVSPKTFHTSGASKQP